MRTISTVATVAVAALPIAGFILGGLAALPFAMAIAVLERRKRAKPSP